MGIYILSGAAYKSQKNPIDNIFSNNLQLFNFYNFSTLTNNVATYDFHSAKKKKIGEIKKKLGYLNHFVSFCYWGQNIGKQKGLPSNGFIENTP